jgi:probable phosphomutase (TIGR03848 family)
VPTLLLVRHGHSSANGEGILAGRLPGIHLTERGRGQAAALGERFAGAQVARVVSSPLERCLETAHPLAAAAGVEVVVEYGLQECAYGAWSGRKLSELAKEPLWSTVQDDPANARFPDHDEYAAESLQEMSDRVVEAVRRHDAQVREEHGEGAVWVAVSHGDLVKAVLAEATGAGLGHFQRYTADPASVCAIRYGERHTFLLSANELSPDLARFRPPADAPATGETVTGETATATDAAPTGDAQVGGGAG